jgi:putative ABC transport system permease protein
LREIRIVTGLREAVSTTMESLMDLKTTELVSSGGWTTSANNETDASSGPVDIPWPHVAISAIPLLVVAVLSVKMQLELHDKVVIAVLRCFSQLSVLGWILVPIFKADTWWLTLLYGIFMVIVASLEAVSRPQHTFHGAFFFVAVILGTVGAATIWFGLFIIVGVSPWYDPQYMIPILGMILGNSCSGISVGLSSILNEFSANRDAIELLLSFGANRMEATRDCVYRSIHLSMMPLINAMNVVGIVSIPGMMTGQILGGSDPWVAAKYQICIFQLIGAAASVSAILLVFVVSYMMFDGECRLADPPSKRLGVRDWWASRGQRPGRTDIRGVREPLIDDSE